MTEESSSGEKQTESPISSEGATQRSWPFFVGTILVAIWVVILAAYLVDRAFNLGFFPTRIERRLIADVKKLTDEDPIVKKKAEEDLFSYHGFSVPILIRGMKAGSEAQKEACAKCLERIAEYYYGAKPGYGPDPEKWEKWWEKTDRRMIDLLDRQAEEEQQKMQEKLNQ